MSLPASVFTLTSGQVGDYLRRIGYDGPFDSGVVTLRGLHRAHMRNVPFENLDIFGGRRKILLDEAGFVRKIVEERRGGYCYELNGSFAALLRAAGFPVSLLSGRVVTNGVEGPEYDHLLLLVECEGALWIADVGFGDSSRDALRLVAGEPQPDGVGQYRLSEHDGSWSQALLGPNGKWKDLYRFSLRPHPLEDFRGMFEYHQTSPDSPFMKNTICSLPTDDGRITLSGNRLIVVKHGERTIHRLVDDAEIAATLRDRFGVVLT